MLKLHDLRPAACSRHKKRRVGRGPASGRGKTAGRGHKGQKSRSGYSRRQGFEGGQMPLVRRVPKRGFNNPTRVEYTVLNVKQLNRFADGTIVNPELLKDMRLFKRRTAGVKILGDGELTASLTVQAHKFTRTAMKKIEAANGKVEVI
ncbi:MAG: 50S ribosomal protein L15 [Candidatus Coatesbacteria bacterium]|nr:MAG: 50S ribosomal protein L15 [Candidatus Coatesbacteria bacterium]